jgi:hypothetical protein
MGITSGDLHGSEFGFKAIDNGLNNSGVFVRDFGIINIPTDGTLGPFDVAVGDTLVLWV